MIADDAVVMLVCGENLLRVNAPRAAAPTLPVLLIMLAVWITAGCSPATPREAVTLTALSSPTGQEWLQNSISSDFHYVEKYFIPQSHPAYCGIASSAIVLNALNVPHNTRWDESTVLNDNTIDTPAKVAKKGLTIAELGALLEAHGAVTETHYADQLSLTEFRQLISANLADPGDFVLVNYSRKAVGQRGGGHISPIAAHHAADDQLLIMDVSAHKYPPTWVATEHLWQAVSTTDRESGLSRGILLVRGNGATATHHLGN